MKPRLKPARLKVNCDVLPSTSAFKLNLRRYTTGSSGLEPNDAYFLLNGQYRPVITVGRCRLTLSNPS